MRVNLNKKKPKGTRLRPTKNGGEEKQKPKGSNLQLSKHLKERSKQKPKETRFNLPNMQKSKANDGINHVKIHLI
jgi:hypothetical protein